MKKRVYVFDVDGTLTPSRGVIDAEFRNFFLDFCHRNDVYLVSGSDRPKTVEQVGLPVYDACVGVYQCNGCEFWQKGRMVSKKDFKPSYEFKHFLINEINKSAYEPKTGAHVEFRTGMCNLSTIGRNADATQRLAYYEWDQRTKEREKLVRRIQSQFKELQVTIGGQISVDIYPKGHDKSQILVDIGPLYEEIIFFADKTTYGGNDWPLAEQIRISNLGETHTVQNWMETKDILEKEYSLANITENTYEKENNVRA